MRLRSVGHVLLDGVETLSAAMQQPNLYIEQLTAPFGSIWKALVALVSSCFAFWIIARLASSDEAFSFNFVNNHTYVYIHTIPLIYIYIYGCLFFLVGISACSDCSGNNLPGNWNDKTAWFLHIPASTRSTLALLTHISPLLRMDMSVRVLAHVHFLEPPYTILCLYLIEFHWNWFKDFWI